MDTLTTLKIMPVKPCNKVQNLPWNADAFLNSHRSDPYPRDMVQAAERALARLDEAMAEDEQIHEANAEAINNNMRIATHVRELMTQIGIHERYSEYKAVGRSKNPKHVVQDAGFVEDLKRCVPLDDGLSKAKEAYHRIKGNYTLYKQKAAIALAEAERKAEQEEQARRWQREADLRLATMIVRYGLPPMATWGDVLMHLRSTNQRLDLAAAMQQTRGDWSDGYWRVHEALERFNAESGEDAQLAQEVSDAAHDTDWGYDGRVFRDLPLWNYDAIFDSVEDQQLANDVRTALEYV